MKIKITNKDCGLEVDKEYDLCDMSAETLIRKRQAVLVEDVVITKPVEKKKTKSVVKSFKGKANESNTK